MVSSVARLRSIPNAWIISITNPHASNPKFHLHYGDLTDSSNLTRILQEVQPDEVYNLGNEPRCGFV